jgi:hypothetical protein
VAWVELDFGKHKGKSLPQVIFADPDWFFWALENKVFDKRAGLRSEANLLNARARSIKPPTDEFSDPVVEYLVHRPTMKFGRFEVVPRSRELHEGGSPAFRSDLIDMSVPRRIAKYDKLGCKSLIASLKHYLFGGEAARITRARAESFFADAANFRI